MKKIIVLAGDYAYIRQIETALKSLCYHNSHVKVYILSLIHISEPTRPY